jgi:hypothetical protein
MTALSAGEEELNEAAPEIGAIRRHRLCKSRTCSGNDHQEYRKEGALH